MTDDIKNDDAVTDAPEADTAPEAPAEEAKEDAPAEAPAEGEAGNDLKEISEKGTAHVQSATDEEHKKIMETMQASTPEEMESWKKKTQALLDSKPEDA